ncbi:MAG TPA: hypothetical protein VGP26_05830 [Actinophytocola sp.]|jgi:hypothetical protein|nr:hypothetical protein [Actinophytocola sp.]
MRSFGGDTGHPALTEVLVAIAVTAVHGGLAAGHVGDRGRYRAGRAVDRAPARRGHHGGGRAAKLARRVRLLSTGHGRKSDEADALVGIAAWSAPELHTVAVDEQIAALRALTEHRDDLVRTRTQPSTDSTPCWSSSSPLACPAASPPTPRCAGHDRVQIWGARCACPPFELVAEVRRVDDRVANTTKGLSDAIARSGNTLSELPTVHL